MKDIQSIPVELSSRYADLYLHATQFDTARQFLLEITKDGKQLNVLNSEVFFNVRCDGGDIISFDCEVLENGILIKNPTEIFKQKGKIEYTLGIVTDVSYNEDDLIEDIDKADTQAVLMRAYFGTGHPLELEDSSGVLLTEDNYILITEHRYALVDILIGCIKVTEQEVFGSDINIDINLDEEIEKVTMAESYVHGGTGTRSGENTDNAKYYKNKTRENVQCICDMGEIAFADLKNVEKQHHFMYTITDEFTSDSTFLDGGGIKYAARTKVIYYDGEAPDDFLIFEDGDFIITERAQDNLVTDRQADGCWGCLQGKAVIGVKGEVENDYRKGDVVINKANVGLPNGVNLVFSSTMPDHADYWFWPITNTPPGDELVCSWDFTKSIIDMVGGYSANLGNQGTQTNVGTKVNGVNNKSMLDLIPIPPLDNPVGIDYRIEMIVRSIKWVNLGKPLCSFLYCPSVFSIYVDTNEHWKVYSNEADETVDLGLFVESSVILNTLTFKMEWNNRNHCIISLYIDGNLIWSTPEYRQDHTTPFLPNDDDGGMWYYGGTPSLIYGFGSYNPSSYMVVSKVKVYEV